ADRRVFGADARRLAADRPHAAEALRSLARRSVSDESRRCGAVPRDRSRRVRSMDVAVTVIKPGMLTTVQDLGRWGFQARGVPVAGPMDPVSHRVANALVGNPRDAALLELTLLGPELAFEDERIVAV